MADTAHIADTASKRPPAAPARAQLGPHALLNETQILTTVFLSSSFIRRLSKMGKKEKAGVTTRKEIFVPYLFCAS